MEFWDQSVPFPELPSKTWANLFWFNKSEFSFFLPDIFFIDFSWNDRFDHDFLIYRRQKLQEYLRNLVRLEGIIESSHVLQQFLEINPSLPIIKKKLRIKSIEQSNHRIHSIERYSEEESVEGGRISFFGTNELITSENNGHENYEGREEEEDTV